MDAAFIERDTVGMGAPIERRTSLGATFDAGGVRVTPLAHVVMVRLPVGAFVWNRPGTVIVERDGRVERLPIVNVTRIAQVALWGCALAALIAVRWWPRR